MASLEEIFRKEAIEHQEQVLVPDKDFASDVNPWITSFFVGLFVCTTIGVYNSQITVSDAGRIINIVNSKTIEIETASVIDGVEDLKIFIKGNGSYNVSSVKEIGGFSSGTSSIKGKKATNISYRITLAQKPEIPLKEAKTMNIWIGSGKQSKLSQVIF